MLTCILVGCIGGTVEVDTGTASEGAVLLVDVVHAPGASDATFRDPQRAVNGVRGGGWYAGSTDVFSLGLLPDVDDVLVLGIDGVLLDVDGPDPAVFENPFDHSGGRFMDPVVVEVSDDADHWVAFPHAFLGEPGLYDDDPSLWRGFAGLAPVHLHAEELDIDPFAAEAGGDVFDLSDLDADDPDVAAVLDGGVRYVRLSSAQLWVDEQGSPFPADPVSNGADIDGVYAASTSSR